MLMPNHLKQLRIKSGYTMKQLSQMSGVSPSTICELEKTGKQPTEAAGERLAKALGVSVDALRGFDHPYVQARLTKPRETGDYLCAYRSSVRGPYTYAVLHYDVSYGTWSIDTGRSGPYVVDTSTVRWWAEIPAAPEF